MSVQAGLAAVTAFLERQGVPHVVVEHEPTQTAAGEARAVGMPPARREDCRVARPGGAAPRSDTGFRAA